MTETLDIPLLIEALKKALGYHGEATIPLHTPSFEGNEWRYVKECIDTSWVSSVGSYVDRFEKQLAEYVGVERAIAVVNGTAALHISLLLAGVQSGDEVLIPSLSFVATANAVAYCNATPHFVDSSMETLGIDVERLSLYLKEITKLTGNECINKHTGNRIRAIVPMHTFGHPVDLEPLIELCDEYHLIMVEDAAESLGSYYKGKHTGSFGLLSAMSFNGNKIITTGGGGAILTNSNELADRAKHLTTTAKTPHRWSYYHDEIGYNYRMPNINAALGCAQLESLPKLIDNKRKLAQRYSNELKDIAGIKFLEEPMFAKSNYWLNAVMLERNFAQYRNDVLEITNTNGIMTRPAWNLLHTLPMFRNSPRMEITESQNIADRLINLPSSASLVVSSI